MLYFCRSFDNPPAERDIADFFHYCDSFKFLCQDQPNLQPSQCATQEAFVQKIHPTLQLLLPSAAGNK